MLCFELNLRIIVIHKKQNPKENLFMNDLMFKQIEEGVPCFLKNRNNYSEHKLFSFLLLSS